VIVLNKDAISSEFPKGGIYIMYVPLCLLRLKKNKHINL